MTVPLTACLPSAPLAQAVGDAAASEGRAAFNMARSQGIFGHMMTSTHCFGPTTDLGMQLWARGGCASAARFPSLAGPTTCQPPFPPSLSLLCHRGPQLSPRAHAVRDPRWARSFCARLPTTPCQISPPARAIPHPLSRWGRIKRTWGEDPFLIGVLNSAHIRGLQGTVALLFCSPSALQSMTRGAHPGPVPTGRDPKRRKISADVNMFAVHNGPDSIRTQFSAFPSQRDVRESFLPGPSRLPLAAHSLPGAVPASRRPAFYLPSPMAIRPAPPRRLSHVHHRRQRR